MDKKIPSTEEVKLGIEELEQRMAPSQPPGLLKKTVKHSLVLALPMVVVAVMFISLAHAASSVVHDPRGDVGSSPSYLDIAHAEVIEQRGKGTLLFMMQLADAIPDEPSQPDLIWPFHVDTNPATFPGGLYNEYVVRVRWVNGAFVGEVVDRTPLLTGGAPIITSIPFLIAGRTVIASVELQLLGNPSSFGWNAATRPGATVPYVDFAPDAANQFDFSTLATWAQ
ncbi:MAG: hypothetical protein HYX72_02665 [Acidobacteria bacterium]|nr:hypothetical protein [Acidobacteriota bacterium]